jgi:hypothetical protein
MVETLADHGLQPRDLVPALMTTHTVANPEYDPAEAKRQADLRKAEAETEASSESNDISEITFVEPFAPPNGPSTAPATTKSETFQTTSRVLETTSTAAVPGVSTSLSAADESVTLDIRWTVLCDLFLVLIADSVYDARSRVLLEMISVSLGLGWLDVVKFEQRVTEALEIQEDVENMEQREIIEGRQKSSRRRRYMMVGLATLGTYLCLSFDNSYSPFTAFCFARRWACNRVIGGSASTCNWSWPWCYIYNDRHIRNDWIPQWCRGCCSHGPGIDMARRTSVIRTFDILPLHNKKRVNAIITVLG